MHGFYFTLCDFYLPLYCGLFHRCSVFCFVDSCILHFFFLSFILVCMQREKSLYHYSGVFFFFCYLVILYFSLKVLIDVFFIGHSGRLSIRLKPRSMEAKGGGAWHQGGRRVSASTDYFFLMNFISVDECCRSEVVGVFFFY